MKYKLVMEYLLNLFQSRNYKEGQQLPTEFDLMEALGVSRNTVRKAIREMEGLGLVERRHGSGTFYVSGEDRPPVSGGLIGLSNFYSMEYIYPEIIRGIEDVLYARGYSLVLANCYHDYTREIPSLERLLDKGIKGLILEPSANLMIDMSHPIMELLKTLNIPVVTTHWGKSMPHFSTVTINDEKAGYDAARYLLDRGHRRIAMLYKDDVQSGPSRFEGYCRALEEADIGLNRDYVVTYDDGDILEDPNQGYRTTRDLLAGPGRDVTAIFYFNDSLALQGYKAIEDAGLTIPRDLSVVGFDNFHSSRTVRPGLTTFEHPKYNLGRWAANLLLDDIEVEQTYQAKELIFEPVLVERDSVRDHSRE